MTNWAKVIEGKIRIAKHGTQSPDPEEATLRLRFLSEHVRRTIARMVEA